MLHGCVSVDVTTCVNEVERLTKLCSLFLGDGEVGGKLNLGHCSTILEDVSTEHINVLGVCKGNVGKCRAVSKCVITNGRRHIVVLCVARPACRGNGCAGGDNYVVELFTAVERIIADSSDTADDADGLKILTVVECKSRYFAVLGEEGKSGDLGVCESTGSYRLNSRGKRSNTCGDSGGVVVENGLA